MAQKNYVLYWKVLHENGKAEICRPVRLKEIQAQQLEVVSYEPFIWGTYTESQNLISQEQGEQIDLTKKDDN